MVHLNVWSLLGKFDDFLCFFRFVNCSLFAVSETWLSDSIPTSIIDIPEFKTYRCDRGSRGGGLLLYVHGSLKSTRLELIDRLNYPDFEQLWVSITFNKKMKIAVAVVYRPSSVPVQCMSDLDTMIRYIQLNVTNHIIVTGDFNIDMMPGRSSCVALDHLLNDLSLTQLINEPTRVTGSSGTCIDLIIVNDSLPVTSSGVLECSLSDHFATTCTVDISVPTSSISRRVVRDFSRFDRDAFTDDLTATNWRNVYSIEDINDKTDYFNFCILNLFDKHAPYKVVDISNSKKSKPWFTDTLRLIRRTKINAFNRYRHTHCPSHRRFYCDIRNYYNFAVREEKRQFYNRTVMCNLNNPRRLWPALRASTPHSFGKSPTTSALNLGYDANTFNNYFIDSVNSTAVQPDIQYVQKLPRHQQSQAFVFQPVSADRVTSLLVSQKPSAAGSDLISARMLQLCLPFCAEPLTHIINISFERGLVPDSWKTSISVPIAKINNPVSLSDFRNISLQCVESKIAETLLHEQLLDFVNGILPPEQSAFRKNYSTSTVCLSVLDDILHERDKGNITALALLDMTRAFDCLNHDLMLAKLAYYGLNNLMLSWFSSYLSQRRQFVKLDDFHFSDLRDVPSGVPQGSVLGPTLFNLYIADLYTVIKYCKYYFYADDVQIYLPFNHNNALEHTDYLNADLQAIYEWAGRNCLRLNPGKSQIIMIGSPHRLHQCEQLPVFTGIRLAGVPLTVADCPKNLGIRFDKHLAFDDHVNHLCRMSYFKLKLLYPLRSHFTQRVRMLLVESLILSVFNYGDCVYGPLLTQENKRRLQVAQNYCVRFIVTVPRYDHITPYIRSMSLLKLHERRFMHYVTLVYKVATSTEPSYLFSKIQFRCDSHSLNLRQNFTVTVPHHNSAKFESSFSYLAAYIFNKLGVLIHSNSLYTIRKSLKIALIQDNLPGIDLMKF